MTAQIEMSDGAIWFRITTAQNTVTYQRAEYIEDGCYIVFNKDWYEVWEIMDNDYLYDKCESLEEAYDISKELT